jgi:hypothetical protein
MNAPGYRTIEHLSRTRRLDTYEGWSEERACSCVAKVLRPDRRDDMETLGLASALHYLHDRGLPHLERQALQRRGRLRAREAHRSLDRAAAGPLPAVHRDLVQPLADARSTRWRNG